ncbi:protein TBATA isoform X2 [Cyclopterus lumpus]|uniref:protein TBATA isoform X2 n=1 Tax=Cyclopterus lumpus TaxID=8103 RepID=UPI0014867A33|nr:protein TBATA isoform X2 [Cyclopterus lumpus]
MSMAQSPASRGKSRERSQSQTNQVPFSPEFSKMLMKSSPRFGSLSHHSFFSRHNPHPNRVKHIQGLNGRPVCMVRDDWFVTSSLFPHPLLKSHVLRKAPNQALAFLLPQNLYGVSTNKSAQFSEAWRDELKDLAAKVSLSPQAQKDKKDDQPEEEFVLRKTQYSAETGRIIPSSTNSYQRRPYSQRLTYPQTFHDQELMVFELLCQILQTDSLSAVQQWLLLAGQREKDLVMGMIKQAMDGADLSGHHQQNFQPLQAFHPGASPSVYGPSSHQPWRKQQRTSLYKEMQASSNDKPERIGDAEVLEVHSEAQEDLQDPLLQNSGCRDGNVGLPFHPD